MLGYEELLELHRALENHWVLTLYLANEVSDPGRASLWRNRLDAVVTDERARAFERAGPGQVVGSAHIGLLRPQAHDPEDFGQI
jgi:hypothetical protein